MKSYTTDCHSQFGRESMNNKMDTRFCVYDKYYVFVFGSIYIMVNIKNYNELYLYEINNFHIITTQE
jgi:hypothetical protein